MLTSPPVTPPPASAPEGAGSRAENALADAAEEVRAWFVLARGGAAFLSSADGRALVDWLEAGVPVSRILCAIDTTAARRRAKRSRRPFSLIDIRPALVKASGDAPRRPKKRPATDGLPEGTAAQHTLDAIRALTGDAEARARAGCELARRFHEDAWTALGAEQADLLAAAAEELAGLADAVDDDVFRSLCEEVARDRLRARYPQLSATRIWEECAHAVD